MDVIAGIHSTGVTFPTNSPENRHKMSIGEFQVGALAASLESLFCSSRKPRWEPRKDSYFSTVQKATFTRILFSVKVIAVSTARMQV